MTLTPIDEKHALQIQAGVLGRKAGHTFEDTITRAINEFSYPFQVPQDISGHVFVGDPAALLLAYVGSRSGAKKILAASAISTGALATSEAGKQWLSVNGARVSRCKSDLVLSLRYGSDTHSTIGVSTKQCNNKNPTNAQLYFTTAQGFTSLLTKNNISVSRKALNSLRQFCGDVGYRPCDHPADMHGRLIDPRRYFWEEIEASGRREWERIFDKKQNEISRLLFQKAYLNDPFVPEFLLHKTKFASKWSSTEVAVYSIDEIVALSRAYQGFSLRPYSVKKGSFRDPPGTTHLAPRFGIIQMQRGGQAQHPEQLQFNLEAGYFYKV